MTSLLQAIKQYIPKELRAALAPFYHFCMAFFAALFYGFPSRRLIVIGVTGTKGKTTVVRMLHHVLEKTGSKVASLSSLGSRIGERETENPMKMTMPGRMAVQKFLHDARKAGSRYAILEVTSEGVKQFRHRFIRFRVGIMTSVHPEHIESHGSYEAYLRAKLDFFYRLPKEAIAVVNKDDAEWKRFAASTRARPVFYSSSEILTNGKSVSVEHVSVTKEGIRFDVGHTAISSPLLGAMNVSNILAVLAFALAQHISLEQAASALRTFVRVPGRMEVLQTSPFTVVVDYAHTPESLRGVYAHFRRTKKTRILCVLGAAGGGRDTWKRPRFGAIAAEYCSTIILTNEDPYDEDPELIMEQIKSGIPSSHDASCILDRREAIRYALTHAAAGDVVVITGKGAEKWMMARGGEKIPWDERAIVEEEIRRLPR